MENYSQIFEKWNELKVLVESLELDIVKNANGSSAAGGRARKGLRLLKGSAGSLVKTILDIDKAKRATKVKAPK